MILVAVGILGAVGLFFGILIAFANRKLKVWEDPRIDVVTGMLPGANCGACGVPGCRAFAELAVAGVQEPSGCNVLDDAGRVALASYLGVDAGAGSKKVARLQCAGGANVAIQQADYAGLETCEAAATVAGGGRREVHGLRRLRGHLPEGAVHDHAARSEADRAVSQRARG